MYLTHTMWAIKWKHTNLFNLSASINKSVPHAKQNTYPNIRTLLQIFLTISCTTASVERNFSNSKRLKMYL